MNRVAVILIIIFVFTFGGFAQKSINDYKYILMPKKFEFSKVDDEHQLNSLTNFLFNKYGYRSYFIDEELPEDLNKDRCLALMADVSNDKSGIFKTKLEIILKDCFGNEVMVSKVGESRLKSFDRAYNEALRAAFETFKDMDYSYNPDTMASNSSKKAEVPDTIEVIEPEEEVPTDLIQETIEQKVKEDLYYAQVVKDGYQLVDSEPKIVMILIQTSAKDVFMVEGRSAIVYKENKQWVYFENNNGEITKHSMQIKF
ncbi:hypothetical protein [Winogradskyella sp.]|uniref:hypothetical protein n=1 Tax=Winogradskyella sp. TaxID=1883156 RepID=UPI003519B5DD